MENTRVLFLIITLFFFSCGKEKSINAKVYKRGEIIGNYEGTFYSTKLGGLNYYISDINKRKQLFDHSKIDSIAFFIKDKKYSAKPLVRKAYSRERNNSDFSFFVNRDNYKINVVEVNKMPTLSLFSEKTDLEELKAKRLIDYTFLNQ